MLKARDNKGFTLMEMLIVVAIIAILVAVAIPTFSSSLTKAKRSTDMANIRSAYAMAQQCTLLEQDPKEGAMASGIWYMQKDGTFEKVAATATTNYVIQVNKDANDAVAGVSNWTKDKHIAISCDGTKWTVDCTSN